MPAALIVQLITVLGPGALELITALINKWENNQNITAAEWAALIADAKLSAEDVMKQRIQAAGIALDDPKAVALINQVKS